MKLKSKKSALLMSFTSLLICFAMLVGSTFAWFTDTATTGVNKIVSGNLKVDIVDARDTSKSLTREGSKLLWTQKVVSGSNETLEAVETVGLPLWEPGVKFLTQGFKIANKGNLALKWKVEVNKGTTAKNDKSADLLKVIDFYVVTEDKEGIKKETALAAFEGQLKDGNSFSTETYYIKGVMDKNAGNEYQNLTLDGITVTVYATQLNYENDSYGPDYDKDATYLTYPAGVTKESFPATADYTNDQGQTKSDAPATVAYVDENGVTKYAADLNTAIVNGASVIYCKEDAKLVGSLTRGNSRTGELTSDLTIYANGADFQNTEISINNTSLATESVGKTKNFTLRVNDAKNIRIWGNTPDNGVTQNIILENCTFEGKGINSDDDVASGGMFYLTGSTGTVNLTMNNCKVSGSNQGVYKACDGDVIVTNSAFEACAAGMKISHKGTGNCNVTVKDTTFNKCGWDTEVVDKPWLTTDSSSIKCKTQGTMALTLEKVTITNVVGDKSIVTEAGVTVNATNVTVDGQAWPAASGGNVDPEPGDEP